MTAALFIALIIALLLLSVFVSWSLGAKNPNRAKYDRFEAGNPPTGEPKGRLAMQYFGYLILLTGGELIALTPLILYVELGDPTLLVAALLSAAVLPFLALWGARRAGKLEDWWT